MNSKSRSQNFLAVLLIATLYIYFLIFAQFAFLENLETQLKSDNNLKIIMGFMGVGGFLCSFFVPTFIKRYTLKTALLIGLGLCSLASLLSLGIESMFFASLVALLIACGIAFVSISTISSLESLLNTKSPGLLIGLGTGIAYFCCNLPILFQASPYNQTIFAAVLCLVVLGFLALSPFHKRVKNSDQFAPQDFSFRKLGLVSCILLFAVLVWLDSAAFYVIQQSTEYKSLTWQSFGRLWANGGVHLVFALLAGKLIDLRQAKLLGITAFLLLAIAVYFLQEKSLQLEVFASVFYCAGVSIYSTALIAYPLLSIKLPTISTEIKAARLYAFAGWLASAMGIGMAGDLHYVPAFFMIIAGTIILFLYTPVRIFKKNLSYLIIFSILFISNVDLVADDAQIRGRQIYLQEGCINCHSQFVRPGTEDEELWGPVAESLDLHTKQIPPLIGNRRVGPDLQNIGNRRNREWLKLHFMMPQIISPGSKMPSYAHLFKDTAGDDLIEYLMSLGADTFAKRVDYAFKWEPKKDLTPIGFENAAILFDKSCTQCHYSEANEEPLLKNKLTIKAPNLFKDPLRFYNETNTDSLNIMRVIKFGIPGSTMPGHEYFSDAEIIGLTNYLVEVRSKISGTKSLND